MLKYIRLILFIVFFLHSGFAVLLAEEAAVADTAIGSPQVDQTAAAVGEPGTSSPQSESGARADTDPASLRGAIGESRPEIRWSLSLGRIFWAVVVLVVVWFGLRYTTKLLEAVAERRVQWRHGIKAAIPILRIGAWTAILYFIIAKVFAPPIQTLLALTASAGIAVGFAAQDILKNIFGGITILFDHPFQVGDKIQIRDHYGEVISIGLRTVRIVTQDDSIVSIPNSELVNQSVSNANSGENNCQAVAEFFFPPDIDLVKLRTLASRAAAVSRFVYLDKPISITFRNEIHQGRSLLKMRLKAYVLDIRYEFPFITDMTELVLQTVLKEGLVRTEDLALLTGKPA